MRHSSNKRRTSNTKHRRGIGDDDRVSQQVTDVRNMVDSLTLSPDQGMATTGDRS